MKILITGCSGFIGRALVRTFSAPGVTIHGVCRNAEAHSSALKGVTVFIGDCSNELFINQLFKDNMDYDVIFHCAARLPSDANMVGDYLDDNILGVASICHNVLSLKKTVRFFYLSTCSVYESHQEAVRNESLATKPKTPYAVTKLAGEVITGILQNQKNIQTFILRLAGVHGAPRSDGLFANIIAKGFRGDTISVSDPTRMFHPLFIEELVHVVKMLINMRFRPDFSVLNIASPLSLTLETWIELVELISTDTNNLSELALANTSISPEFDISALQEKIGVLPPRIALDSLRNLKVFLKSEVNGASCV